MAEAVDHVLLNCLSSWSADMSCHAVCVTCVMPGANHFERITLFIHTFPTFPGLCVHMEE